MKTETKVGMLFLGSIGLIVGFAYFLGFVSPFSQTHQITLLYNFAGGIEVGSPLRAMGIKVGKVKAIDFDPMGKTAEGEEVKLKILVEIDKKAWPTVRKDSKFYINLAGVIGERYIEITPGSLEQPVLEPGQLVRGIDPPRVDQLLSQGYALAGKALEMLENNESSISNTIAKMDSLVTNLNKTLVLLDKVSKKKEFNSILNNAEQISSDVLIVTSKLRGPEAQKTMGLMSDLLWRLDKINEKSIRVFLQEEGIRARLF